jgi:NAD(P)-dependent dehydrogenase (short-subunit alcohol dehydrogenase family)
VHAVVQQSQGAPDGAPLHYERHCPEQTTLYRLVQQQHAASFIANTEASTGAELPRSISKEFDAFLECSAAGSVLPVARGACGREGFAAFASAKHALRALAQSMAHELWPQGIHVAHPVVDDAIDTEFIRSNFPERYALNAATSPSVMR